MFRLKGLLRYLSNGINLKFLKNLKYLKIYRKNKREWLNKGGKITRELLALTDFADPAGKASGHYFHQDLLVAQFIYKRKPVRHVDVGSRIEGFVTHVASFREIEVLDIRPLKKSIHQNIIFKKADFMKNQDIGLTDSLSCLHAIEHFGLGRYHDPIDIDGHIRGIENLVKLIKKDGYFYISFPIGKDDEVHFNAHRVFHPKTILNLNIIKQNMRLIRYDYVDDQGELFLNSDVESSIGSVSFGCGIYTFKKIL